MPPPPKQWIEVLKEILKTRRSAHEAARLRELERTLREAQRGGDAALRAAEQEALTGSPRAAQLIEQAAADYDRAAKAASELAADARQQARQAGEVVRARVAHVQASPRPLLGQPVPPPSEVVPGLVKWNMYAGGTGAAEGKHAYDFYLPNGGQYSIQPISGTYGRHRGYHLDFADVASRTGTAGLHKDLGMFRSPQEAASAAAAHAKTLLPPSASWIQARAEEDALSALVTARLERWVRGSNRPERKSALDSLVEKGYATVEETAPGAFSYRYTPAGLERAKELKLAWKGETWQPPPPEAPRAPLTGAPIPPPSAPTPEQIAAVPEPSSVEMPFWQVSELSREKGTMPSGDEVWLIPVDLGHPDRATRWEVRRRGVVLTSGTSDSRSAARVDGAYGAERVRRAGAFLPPLPILKGK